MGLYFTTRWRGRRKRALMFHKEPVFFEISRWEISLMTPFFAIVLYA